MASDIKRNTDGKNEQNKEVKQVVIKYDDKEYSNCYEKVDNPRLKIKFSVEIQTRKKADIEEYINKLGRSDADKWIKEQLNKVLEG